MLTKTIDGRFKKYELRSIQFDTSSWMEHIELVRYINNSNIIRLTEHQGVYKGFEVNGNCIYVYKQTYNRNKDPRDNYSEFFTTNYGLILVNDRLASKELIHYKGKKLTSEISELYSLIKIDSSFFTTDTISIFETWEEIF